MAFPPEILNHGQTHEDAKNQTLWTSLPIPVQRELVQAMTVMLTATLLPHSQEERHD